MTAHHRHQSSLENIIDFSSPQTLSPDVLAQAEAIFTQLIDYNEPLQTSNPYKKVTLVHLTYEHARKKEAFLRQFFLFLDILDTQNDQDADFTRGMLLFSTFSPISSSAQKKAAENAVNSFADYLFNNFFLPLRASTNQTPQPTPASLSVQVENVVGTPARLSVLQRDCLTRDHNRCVITRSFNMRTAEQRIKNYGANAKDDEGQLFTDDPTKPSYLEVAHIIPHSMIETENGKDELSPSKKSALAILHMFDSDVIPLIEGTEIDRPTNAITLTHQLHRTFGEFECYFQEADPSVYPPHTYEIDSVITHAYIRPPGLPATRTLLLSPNHTVDPPSSKLLAVHRSVSIILYLSAAGEHIDKILRDMEELWVRSDGSAEIGHLVSLRMGGWVTA